MLLISTPEELPVILLVSVNIPDTTFPSDFKINSVAAIPVNWLEISSKIIFTSFGTKGSTRLENDLPEKDEFTSNPLIPVGPYGGEEKWISSRMIL